MIPNPKTEKPQKNIHVDDEEMKRFNEESITSNLITPDKIYVDLMLFKDINLSAVLSFLKDRWKTIPLEEYSSLYGQVLDKLPEYNERKFDDFAHIFPFMGVSNAQIKERQQDKSYASWILREAPSTRYVDFFQAQLAVNVNHSAVIGKRDPIEVTINTYPLQLSKEDELFVAVFFAEAFKIHARVIYLDMTTVRLNNIFQFEEMYTYYFHDLFKVEEIRDAYSALRFVKKRLYVPRLFGNNFEKNKPVEKEELYTKTHFDVLTNFEFVPAHIFSTPPPTIVKEKPNNG